MVGRNWWGPSNQWYSALKDAHSWCVFIHWSLIDRLKGLSLDTFSHWPRQHLRTRDSTVWSPFFLCLLACYYRYKCRRDSGIRNTRQDTTIRTAHYEIKLFCKNFKTDQKYSDMICRNHTVDVKVTKLPCVTCVTCIFRYPAIAQKKGRVRVCLCVMSIQPCRFALILPSRKGNVNTKSTEHPKVSEGFFPLSSFGFAPGGLPQMTSVQALDRDR